MNSLSSKEYKKYATFLNNLAKDLTKFYYSKLNKTFKVSNKLKGKGYDPVTSADKAFEKFIRKEINKSFPNHQVIGEEFGHKKSNSDFNAAPFPLFLECVITKAPASLASFEVRSVEPSSHTTTESTKGIVFFTKSPITPSSFKAGKQAIVYND